MAVESRFRKFLTTNGALFTFVGALLGAIGIVISIVSINSSNPARSKPTLLVDPVRTTVVDSRFFPNSFLKLPNSDSVLIQSDITALRVIFWNAGQQPIRLENVIQPLRIGLNDTSSKILDYKVLKVSRPDVVKIGLKPSEKDPLRELIVEFNILEKNDGFTCEVIYLGNPLSTVNLLGAIEGVRKIDNNETVLGDRVWSLMFWLVPSFLIVSVITVFVVWNAVTLALRFAVWRHTTIENRNEPASSRSSLFSYYVARFIPHLSVVALIVAVILISFIGLIVLTREYARVTIMESVPRDIRP